MDCGLPSALSPIQSSNNLSFHADWAGADLIDLSNAGNLEFSSWDAITNTRSHIGLLKMRYLVIDDEDVQDIEWSPVCYPPNDDPVIPEEIFGQRICESMDFHSSHSSSMSQSVDGLYNPGRIWGCPIYCHETEDCHRISDEKYCYVKHTDEEENYDELASYFFWIECICREGFQRTNIGCAGDEEHIFGLDDYNFALWEDVNSETSDGIVMVKRSSDDHWGYFIDPPGNGDGSKFGEQVARFICKTLKYDKMIGFGRVADNENYQEIQKRVRYQSGEERQERHRKTLSCEYQDSTSYGKCRIDSWWGESEPSLSAVHLCCTCTESRYRSSTKRSCQQCLSWPESAPDNFCSCPAGQYWNFSQNDCVKCPENYFSSVGSTSCTPWPCPVSQMSGPGSDRCVRCELGQHWENHTCHACPEGYHGDSVHCILCPEGYTAVKGLCARAEMGSDGNNYKDVAIIGLVILAVLLALGVIFTIVMMARGLVKNRRSSGTGRADNVAIKEIVSTAHQTQENTC